MTSSSSSDTDFDDKSGSEYIPTPLRLPQRRPSPVKEAKTLTPYSVPHHCLFVDTRQLEHFVEQLNDTMGCKTAGCQGKLVVRDVTTRGMGGTATVVCMCTGCRTMLEFPTSSRNTTLAKNDIKLAAQVAFLAAGCTYETYAKVLKHVLGIKVVSHSEFIKTIGTLHPIVEKMVNELCEGEKNRMKDMNDDELGSWKRAVTCADGVWMTRGFHSQNATYSIRNYFTGALLYYLHICQKGSDKIIDEELYKGSSKSAEGYAALVLVKTAKEEGMNIEIHWQDADSSSSKPLKEIFPGAAVMTCGGHTGRAHLHQLQIFSKSKTLTNWYKNKHKDDFPEVNTVVCCKRHHVGYGCMTDAFCQRARNNFSNILSSSDSPQEFSERLLNMVHHVQGVHKWEGGQCQFHALRVCSCNKCPDKNQPQCEGKDYTTREVLTCPLHLLVYKIECHVRAQMASKLIHPILKRGHSNWLESSHNVIMRFRNKHIHLERLHYHVSTNLGLLQANMTQEGNQQGLKYHWKTDLLQRLGLPVYDGVLEYLESHNRTRMKGLARAKTAKGKKRRVELKTLRTQNAKKRLLWTGKHGRDTYSEEDKREDIKPPPPKSKKIKDTAASKKSKSTVTENDNLTVAPAPPPDLPVDPDKDTVPPIKSEDTAVPKKSKKNRDTAASKKFTKNKDTAASKKSKRNENTSLKRGDYVCIHHNMKDMHMCCRIVDHTPGSIATMYSLCCIAGVLEGMQSETEVTISAPTTPPISTKRWRNKGRITLKDAWKNAENLQKCDCVLLAINEEGIVDLTNAQTKSPPNADSVWIDNAVYILHESDWNRISGKSTMDGSMIPSSQHRRNCWLSNFQTSPDCSRPPWNRRRVDSQATQDPLLKSSTSETVTGCWYQTLDATNTLYTYTTHCTQVYLLPQLTQLQAWHSALSPSSRSKW